MASKSPVANPAFHPKAIGSPNWRPAPPRRVMARLISASLQASGPRSKCEVRLGDTAPFNVSGRAWTKVGGNGRPLAPSGLEEGSAVCHPRRASRHCPYRRQVGTSPYMSSGSISVKPRSARARASRGPAADRLA